MKTVLKGFTLAEVLITLGIIGIVAAMTIPTLMKNTQDAELKSAWKKAYSVISQASLNVKNDNGGTFAGLGSAFDLNSQNTLRDAYTNYLKVVKKCDADAYGLCFHPESGGIYLDTVKLLNGTSHLQCNSYLPYFFESASGVILPDGQLVLFAWVNTGTACTFSIEGYTNDCGFMTVDVNGFKGPNTVGRDIFAIEILENKIVPAGTGTLSNTCSTSSTGQGCAARYLYE